MASFSIADDSVSALTLDESTDSNSKQRTGNIRFTVRNVSGDKKLAQMRVVTAEGADPQWFSFVDAAATHPQFVEVDFAADSTQTVEINIVAEGQTADVVGQFHLRVTEESDPDNDFVEGPSVELTVPKDAERVVVVNGGRGWWKYVAAAIVVLGIGGYAYYELTKGPDFVPVIGYEEEDAVRRLQEDGNYLRDNIIVTRLGQATGGAPDTVVDQRVVPGDRDKIQIDIDPGVVIPIKNGDNALDAMKALSRVGLVAKYRERRRKIKPFLVIEGVSPGSGTVVAKGSEVSFSWFVYGEGRRIGNLDMHSAAILAAEAAERISVMGSQAQLNTYQSQKAEMAVIVARMEAEGLAQKQNSE